MLTDRYAQALDLAQRWHATQKRKGTEIPYLAHLMAVSALVLEHGADEDEAVAALLHDSLEDAPDQGEAERRREEVRTRFGPGVLAVVEACTDADPQGKAAERDLQEEGRRAAWRRRKEGYIEHLAHAPGSVVLVATADKLHNATAIVRDRAEVGPSVWDRFVGGRDGTLWYYRTLLEVLAGRVAREPRIRGMVRELERVVGEMG